MKLANSLSERIATDCKWRRKFAWFPVTLADGSIIWMEWYETRSEYIKTHNMGFWRHVNRAAEKRGTSSGGPCAPTEKERNMAFTGGPG